MKTASYHGCEVGKITLSHSVKTHFILIVTTATRLSATLYLNEPGRFWLKAWQTLLVLAEGIKGLLNASVFSRGDLNSYKGGTYHTSLDYLVSLSTGTSWFKNQLQQVECCDGDFVTVYVYWGRNIIWWNNYWGIEEVAWFILLQWSVGCPIKTRVLAVDDILFFMM